MPFCLVNNNKRCRFIFGREGMFFVWFFKTVRETVDRANVSISLGLVSKYLRLFHQHTIQLILSFLAIAMKFRQTGVPSLLGPDLVNEQIKYSLDDCDFRW